MRKEIEIKNITHADVTCIQQIAHNHVQMLQEDPTVQKGMTTMMCALYEEMILRRLQYDQECIRVVLRETLVVSYIWAHFDQSSKTVTIESLYIHPDYRQQGIAMELKQYVENWARSLKAHHVIGTVLATNTAMQSLNEKLGYRVQKVIMHKPLDSD
ncbi:GNAT family acetyltransferase [Staphylococcus agnetis]|uniref:GNAT family N-acetyltransferase n=1 Tax=Staphylococcus agnetis TaxID=985762 RepID=UPI000E05A867|nr:GNAT family N-acetyltransferase [Staphylococcus agnetis]SUK17041.1 GNAT family acetyltransferase [Staphylococcus agnetis]